MIKTFKKLHLWLAVPFGLVITLICFSGAMLVFESEITRQIQKDVYYVSSVNEKPLPMEQLMETAKASLPDSVAITGVTVFKDKSRTYQVNLSKPMRASMFIDQYSGKITGRTERIGFFSAMFKLHRWLLDPAGAKGDGIKVGKLIVGISTLMFVIALITGVVIWWPRARKNLKRSLTISIKKGWSIFWRQLHVAGGMYAVLVILAMALTGLTWSFEWYNKAFYSLCGVEAASHDKGGKPKDKGDRKAGRGEASAPEFIGWQKVYDELSRQYPDAQQITVSPGSVSVKVSDYGNMFGAERYNVTAKGNDVSLQPAPADDKAKTATGWVMAVHTGAWGGIFTRILWMLCALLGASLPLTGYYIWMKRLRMKN